MIAAASFLLVELLLVVTDPYLFKGMFQYEPDMGYQVRAYYPSGYGSYGDGKDVTPTNRFGFNAPDFPLAKPPGTFRIVVVGDSYGWAGGLNGNYTHQLQEMFDRQGDRRVEIINTGYPGTHTGEQLIMLKKYALQYDPDLVLLGFFAGNDFLDADPNRKRLVLNDCFFDIDKRYEHRLAGYPVVPISRARLILSQKDEIRKSTKQAQLEAEDWARTNGQPLPLGNLPEQTFYFVQRVRLSFFNQKTSAEQFGPNVDFIFRSIAEMDDLLKARRIKFMVAIYPDELQVNPTQFETLLTRFSLRRDDYDLNLAQTRLRSFLGSRNIPYLDLLDRFRQEEQRESLYGFHTTHWNLSGNRLAAEMLFDYLHNSSDGANLLRR